MIRTPIVDLLKRAGDRSLAYWRTGPLVFQDKGTKGRGVDLVTEADLAVDRLIVEGLDRLHPGIPVLSEEGDWRPPEGPKDDMFVLDPIDGTHNFAQGTHWWTISLARTRGALVEEGWLYQPTRGTLWHARRGQGTTRDGERVSVSTTEPRLGLVSVSLSQEMLPLLLQATRFAGIRALGSHAICLGMVADGSFLMHAGRGYPWDVAAGHLFVQESGGRVCTLAGDERSLWERVQTLSGAPASVEMALEIFAAAR
jgi:myo-inositol-1(or 4)-monophosphatase